MLLSNFLQLEQAKTPVKYNTTHPGGKGPTTRNHRHQRLVCFQTSLCSLLSYLRRTNRQLTILISYENLSFHLNSTSFYTFHKSKGRINLLELLVINPNSDQTSVALAGIQINFRGTLRTFHRRGHILRIHKVKLLAAKTRRLRASAPTARAFIRKSTPDWQNGHKLGDLSLDLHLYALYWPQKLEGFFPLCCFTCKAEK